MKREFGVAGAGRGVQCHQKVLIKCLVTRYDFDALDCITTKTSNCVISISADIQVVG